MTSLRSLLAFFAVLCAMPAASQNHDTVVPPLPAGPFAVACSNLEHDMAVMQRLGGEPVDYWEGNTVDGSTRYVNQILAHPGTAIQFDVLVPDNRSLYPGNAGDRVSYVAAVCHPTPRSNADPSYAIPSGLDVLPHMQRAGAAPKLISTAEYLATLGIVNVAAPPAGPARLPFVVFSHGLGGSPIGPGYVNAMVALASYGYVVGAVFHADARFSRLRVEDLGDYWYLLTRFGRVAEMQLMRPLSLKAMTDTLLSNPGFSPGIDPERIGGFGASLGGQALAHLMGARMTTTIGGSCQETVRDSRIRATVGLVPYAGQTFLPAFCDDQRGAEGVTRPYLAIAGTADTTAPFGMVQQAVNRFQGTRYLVRQADGRHEFRPEDAGDVFTWTVTFLNAYLPVPGDPSAMARLIRMNGVQGGRVDDLVIDVHVPSSMQGGELPAREFHHEELDHYFIAAGQDEIDSILAGGAGPGWRLTGQAFKAWPRIPPDAFSTVGPVCRFYGVPAGGPNSHFFTASPAECEMVKRNGGWYYEGIGFYIEPVTADGRCREGLLAVNRAYNNGYPRNDSNHRFSTSDSTMREMGHRGWAVEGTAMCARP